MADRSTQIARLKKVIEKSGITHTHTQRARRSSATHDGDDDDNKQHMPESARCFFVSSIEWLMFIELNAPMIVN